jgi:hypothetical protein
MSLSFPYDEPCDDPHTYDTPLTNYFTSTPLRPPLPPHDDFSSNTLLPRSARAAPHAQTVHSIFIKILLKQLSLRPDELWIVELNSDGHETWRSIESFLETLHLTGEDRTICYVANPWRHHYEVLALHRSAALHDMTPVLPHPEHSNISFGQPVSVIPDHTAILQACWGRSAATLKVILLPRWLQDRYELHLLLRV